jgi:hypothetical protein
MMNSAVASHTGPSCPDLARASTSFFIAVEFVDGKAKPWHDETMVADTEGL